MTLVTTPRSDGELRDKSLLVKSVQDDWNPNGEGPVAGCNSAKAQSNEEMGLVRHFHASSRSKGAHAISKSSQERMAVAADV